MAKRGVSSRSAALQNVNLGVTEIKDANGEPTGRTWPSNLMNADCTGSDMDGAQLASANLGHTCFDECKLNDADFSGATLTGTTFNRAEVDPSVIPAT